MFILSPKYIQVSLWQLSQSVFKSLEPHTKTLIQYIIIKSLFHLKKVLLAIFSVLLPGRCWVSSQFIFNQVSAPLYIQVTMNTVQTVGNSQHRRGPAKGRSSLDILEVRTCYNRRQTKMDQFPDNKIVYCHHYYNYIC